MCSKTETDAEEEVHKKALEKWTVEDVYTHFSQLEGLKDAAAFFKAEEISGEELWDLTCEHCKSFTLGKFMKIEKEISKLKKLTPLRPVENIERVTQYKIFCDPIHGFMDLHPLCVEIIDTPQFQRLRQLKQLGATYLVYPGAAHNRFEHSVGVCYLAGKMMEGLRKRQPELDIIDRDILCVQIAGLCHDLGHGPFSHLFEDFMEKVRPEIKWKHEYASVELLRQMRRENGLQRKLDKYGITEDDMIFIEEMIEHPPIDPQNKVLKGRTRNKAYMYDIVSNAENGIDVDKFDYFARDCHQLGFTSNFDHRRYMKLARVIDVNRRPRICTRDKDIVTVCEMFQTRAMLHRRAYQHKTVLAVNTMILDALTKANDFFKVAGTECKMSDAVDDIAAFQHLNDNVFYDILHSTDQNLETARDTLQNILKRKIMKFVDSAILRPDAELDENMKSAILRSIAGAIPSTKLGAPPLEAVEYSITVAELSYGLGDKHPLSSVYFYKKSEPNKATSGDTFHLPEMVPNCCQEQHLYIYCSSADRDKHTIAKQCAKQWIITDPQRIVKHNKRIRKDSM